ncbi:helix-turn-helix transcriptional regulator [Ferribacterium limneticum]|uniref:helix-turn-helix transcriptional regulator n=1 Tax=Ferribacterium limneticum TaxID=76259 RepID=UPI001CFA966A|nr:AlpA family phage regulatory protein [Ferribacterium limneticum]UCV28081.1 AlpA family phage regulatory protein [Ferribacterium limneticum]UCV31998.1 AlpA family phage regulatory protein [Ferribacterium limneticum]
MPNSKKTKTSAIDYKLPVEGFVRMEGVRKVIPMSRSAILADIDAGRFPQPVHLGPRRVGFRVEEIRAYIADPAAFNGL